MTTIQCTSCQADIPEESRFCPVCGASTDDTAAQADETARKVSSLLSQANLARMRGQWEEAELRCSDAMRADPYNVHAYSLLGDIFRDQNKLDEASQWYHMALDLNPNSTADDAKLDMVERELERQNRHTAGSASHKPDSAEGAGITPVVWLKLIGLSCAVFVVIVIAVLLIRNSDARRNDSLSGANSTAVSSPSDTVNLSHNALPPATPPPPTGGAVAAQPRRGQANMDMASSIEATVQAALVRNSTLSPEVTVGAVLYHPRDMGITVQLIVQPQGDGMAQDSLHDAALKDGLRAAQAAFAADSAVQHASISVRTNGPSGRPEVYFEGDIERAVAGAASPNAPVAQIAMVYNNTWWGPIGAAGPSEE